MIEQDSLNVLVLGETGAGKTHMYQEYTCSREGLFTQATVCLEVHAKSLSVRGRVLDACFYEVTGDAGARLALGSLLRRLFGGGMGLHAVNLHCDATQPQSIDAMVEWVRWLHGCCAPQPADRELAGLGDWLAAVPVFITASQHVDEKSQQRIVAHLQTRHGIRADEAVICFPAEDYRLADALDERLVQAASYRRQLRGGFVPLGDFLR